MGSPESETVAGIGVGVVDVAAHALYGEVGIDVDNGPVAYLYALVVGVLHGKGVEDGGVVGRVVSGEVAHVSPKFHTEDFGYVEGDVGVCVDAYYGQGEHVRFRGVLPRYGVVPAEDAEMEVLAEGGAQHLYAAALLPHCYVARPLAID